MFQKIQKPIGVSDFRASISTYLKKAKDAPLVISSKNGGNPFVVLSVDAYNKIVESREDYEDSMELQKRMRAKDQKFYSLESLKNEVDNRGKSKKRG